MVTFPSDHNWDKARIATRIVYTNPSDNTEKIHTCVMVNRVSFKATFNYEPYHGLSEWNQGVIEKPPEFTFTIAIPATSDTTRLLRALHVSGLPFNMDIRDATAGNSEFALITEVLVECRITSKEVNINVGELPMVVFNGMALRYTYSDPASGSSNIKNNALTQDAGELFGGGQILATANSPLEEW